MDSQQHMRKQVVWQLLQKTLTQMGRHGGRMQVTGDPSNVHLHGEYELQVEYALNMLRSTSQGLSRFYRV